ncbi:MAG: TIGR00341 family protein [Luteolibacter sp.]
MHSRFKRQWAKAKEHQLTLFPSLEREDRLILVENLTENSRWSMNFGVMLGCSVIIAGLGLLQDSVAVIIGAMLVAPMMTPLIGGGLALVHGNHKLLGQALRAILMGTAMSLILGVLLRWLTPGQELTMQVSLRGSPNLLDLAIAFFAGVAAGYAVARPKLSGALPGVAISVALVPPLAASGIALGSGDWLVSMGAMLLFSTNMVAITLGSAMVFRLHGIATPESRLGAKLTMKRIMLGMGAALILMTAPLAYRLSDQLRQGQAKPENFTLSEEMWFKLHNRLDREEGIDFLTGVRASSKRPEDVVIVLSASRPVPGKLIAELDEMIDRGISNDLTVKFNIVQQGSVDDLEDAIGNDGEKSEPVINE